MMPLFLLFKIRYPELCANVTGKGRNHRAIKLQLIVQALGKARTATLPAFHALSGADNTGCFLGHAKPLCWKAFRNVGEDVVGDMTKLGTAPTSSEKNHEGY